MSIVNPAVPAGAFDDFLRAGRPAQRAWTPDDGPFPAFYVSHGAPPVFDDPLWIRQLSDWALSLPTPRAILVVSAHWESERAVLSSPLAGTPLVYDFGGFHRRYFEMRYATPDATALARQVAALMPADEPLHVAGRGLDHGAWVPLKVMYPDADVPVLQLSMPTHDPDRLLALGRRLRPLREQGVLVIGSGFMTHGLQFATREMFLYNEVPTWSREFDAWVAEALARGDVDALADYHRAPGMPYAHPTVEHYTPLFITLGAATDAAAPPTTVIDDFQMGFAKRSLQVA
ncbi:dioxygenase family protein [Kineococcus rhizosphaerae]|uniref:4,5-DOPA dioxygenase extradiol n=1 Tax=Kineococcus rhizosphaerae TaxID=559628 RepID=A0A2T0QZG2_9ACTN|nr:class III extradiol ring-cleavage dioxygenase [Kineococcus rhizosphaerae]PRY12074.1 4,5-DOPA dioxygenase extradiol [Kineococcus rhizosphaerae]